MFTDDNSLEREFEMEKIKRSKHGEDTLKLINGVMEVIDVLNKHNLSQEYIITKDWASVDGEIFFKKVPIDNDDEL